MKANQSRSVKLCQGINLGCAEMGIREGASGIAEFIGLSEQFNNPNFNSTEFDGIKKMVGSNSFSLTP